jgi:hypothetical protein
MAAQDGRDCTRADVGAAKAAVKALDDVGDLAIADGPHDVAVKWWALADRVGERILRLVSMLQS